MDQCTHEVCLRYWEKIISQCQARPAGQSARKWLTDNGICEQTYYLWQRKIRQSAYAQMQTSQQALPDIKTQDVITFAEVPVSHFQPDIEKRSDENSIKPVAVIQAASYSVAVTADIPETLLSLILREVSHA